MGRLLTELEAIKFKEILDNYQPNKSVLELFRKSNFAVIAGPAGAGKDTLRNGLLNRYPAKYLPILSTTTRPARAGEVSGKTYHFQEVGQVEESLIRQEFFQTALVHNQQVSCLHVDEIQKLMSSQFGLSILIPSTEAGLRTIKSDIKTIFLIPKNLDVLMERIKLDRNLGQAEVNRRLEAAQKEIKQALESKHYLCLISDTVENVVGKAHSFLQDEGFDKSADAKARQAMKKIMLELSYGR